MEYIKSSDLRERGWTDTLINAFAYACLAPGRLEEFVLSLIQEVEQSERFKVWRESPEIGKVYDALRVKLAVKRVPQMEVERLVCDCIGAAETAHVSAIRDRLTSYQRHAAATATANSWSMLVKEVRIYLRILELYPEYRHEVVLRLGCCVWCNYTGAGAVGAYTRKAVVRLMRHSGVYDEVLATRGMTGFKFPTESRPGKAYSMAQLSLHEPETHGAAEDMLPDSFVGTSNLQYATG